MIQNNHVYSRILWRIENKCPVYSIGDLYKYSTSSNNTLCNFTRDDIFLSLMHLHPLSCQYLWRQKSTNKQKRKLNPTISNANTWYLHLAAAFSHSHTDTLIDSNANTIRKFDIQKQHTQSSRFEDAGIMMHVPVRINILDERIWI